MKAILSNLPVHHQSPAARHDGGKFPGLTTVLLSHIGEGRLNQTRVPFEVLHKAKKRAKQTIKRLFKIDYCVLQVADNAQRGELCQSLRGKADIVTDRGIVYRRNLWHTCAVHEVRMMRLTAGFIILPPLLASITSSKVHLDFAPIAVGSLTDKNTQTDRLSLFELPCLDCCRLHNMQRHSCSPLGESCTEKPLQVVFTSISSFLSFWI